ncbi:MAG: cobalamin-binding protein [Pseudomonadales bacterium]|nr:cobalamin-binding protein [Pseudomonadales bacterium]
MRLVIYLFCLCITATEVSAQSEPAKRIVALSPHSVELLYAIGAGHTIVGTVEFADTPPEALNIPRLGNYAGIQIERVVAAQPDLIIAWRTGNKTEDLTKLESLGYPMFFTQPETVSQIPIEVRKLGALTGYRDNAEALAEQLTARYQKLLSTYKNLRPVRVFYQLWHDPIRSVGPGSWVDGLIRDCGGENIFGNVDNDYPIVAKETVISHNPEIIIIPEHSGTQTSPGSLWERWPEIAAVRNGRVISLNGDLLHRFTPRALDGLEQLCQAINRAR